MPCRVPGKGVFGLSDLCLAPETSPPGDWRIGGPHPLDLDPYLPSRLQHKVWFSVSGGMERGEEPFPIEALKLSTNGTRDYHLPHTLTAPRAGPCSSSWRASNPCCYTSTNARIQATFFCGCGTSFTTEPWTVSPLQRRGLIPKVALPREPQEPHEPHLGEQYAT